ncbi:MAG: class I SAM-dependent methyltransferase [Sulfuricaulis sp.]
MFWEKRLENWANGIRERLALPMRVDLWNGQQLSLSHEQPEVIIHVPHASALACLFTPSLSNLGAAYVDGRIDVDGKPGAIISISNALAAGTLKMEGKFSRMVRKVQHSKKKDREAIKYHYDVSNEFYMLWLDKNLVYSCAYFENGDEDLATAQTKKIDHILKKIQVRAGNTLLDIGCGWGALVLQAAKNYGAKCVGITLSENQATYATALIDQAGLSDRIEIRLQDYRDIKGTFDRITSVGMFEHVGIKNLSAYFSKMSELLNDGGIAMNHGITSTDAGSGETPYGNGEFIEKYVFPHGELPHISLALKSMQEGGLEVVDIENLRRHYAKTCEIWAENFEVRADEIKRLAGDRRYRIWRVYLAGCAYAFNRDWISLYQVVCVKAGKNPSMFPWSRSYMYGQAEVQKNITS